MIFPLKSLKFNANGVRLGEHDFSTTADGEHQDIRIALAEPHEHHDDTLKLNDIAILHLYYDVKFNGKLKFLEKSLMHSTLLILFDIIYHYF